MLQRYVLTRDQEETKDLLTLEIKVNINNEDHWDLKNELERLLIKYPESEEINENLRRLLQQQ